MKTKIIYTAIVTAIFIAAMIIFREKNTLPEIIAYFVGAGGTLAAVYNWLVKNEAQKELRLVRRINRNLQERVIKLRLKLNKRKQL